MQRRRGGRAREREEEGVVVAGQERESDGGPTRPLGWTRIARVTTRETRAVGACRVGCASALLGRCLSSERPSHRGPSLVSAGCLCRHM